VLVNLLEALKSKWCIIFKKADGYPYSKSAIRIFSTKAVLSKTDFIFFMLLSN